MKSGGLFLLAALLALGMDLIEALDIVQVGTPRSGACPNLPVGTIGMCAEWCSGDDSCPQGQKCCSNGCGHACMPAVTGDEVHIPQSCCYSWSKKPIPLHLLSGYFVTSSKCSLEAVIFKTVKGVEVCADPKEKWVQDRMRRLKIRRKKP
ncbi:C-C motif chemokine 20-like [Ornithorhynchus anatinus]|nr:C-C motif chemokine 20-like [Ornithorhynchus anatinus]XP_039770383.1 C-C motif chemokine 20-like [Ornithorhynchus anatinus]XP_039770384.1 C-C motif chemokine 20-like [Ornithorhynchus anatinus]